MRIELLSLSTILLAATTTAQDSSYPAPHALRAGANQIAPPTSGSFLGGGADCSSPTVIGVGTVGGVPFDNTVPASVAVTNPFEVVCEHQGVNGIELEEWFSWTAATTGVARIATCGLTTVDTKIAIYADDCPNIASLDPIACHDLSLVCGGGTNFQTVGDFNITAGTTYLIQLGAFPALGGAVGGVGAFDITEFPPLPDGQYDMGMSVAANGIGAGGTVDFNLIVGNTFDAGVGATITSVDIAWGVPAVGVPPLPAGWTARLVIYSGDTNSLTYLADQIVTPMMLNTDTFVNYPLTTPVAVSGLYSVALVGEFLVAEAPFFVFTWSDTVNSLDTVGGYNRSWTAIEQVALPVDFMNPLAAQGPPNSNQFWGDDKLWFIRSNTTEDSYPDSCSGDGGNQMGCTSCPCGNDAMAGTIGGCSNSAGTSTRLEASGSPSVSLPSGSAADLQFTATGSPPGATNVLLSGNAVAPTGMANPCFGLDSGILSADRDGLRCIVQSVVRHGNRAANAMGEIMDPSGPNRVWGGPAQPVDGIAVQGGFIAGQTRHFQITHRDDAMAVCMRGLNTSQVKSVTFTP